MTVLQIDREAAAKLLRNRGECEAYTSCIVNGANDDGDAVQAFSAHREQATAVLVEALEWAIAEIEGRTRYDTDLYNGAEQRDNALDCARLALTKVNGDA